MIGIGLTLLLASACGCSAHRDAYRFQVIDGVSRAPIANVQVYWLATPHLAHVNQVWEKNERTDANGEVLVNTIPDYSYHIAFRHPGYQTFTAHTGRDPKTILVGPLTTERFQTGRFIPAPDVIVIPLDEDQTGHPE